MPQIARQSKKEIEDEQGLGVRPWAPELQVPSNNNFVIMGTTIHQPIVRLYKTIRVLPASLSPPMNAILRSRNSLSQTLGMNLSQSSPLSVYIYT